MGIHLEILLALFTLPLALADTASSTPTDAIDSTLNVPKKMDRMLSSKPCPDAFACMPAELTQTYSTIEGRVQSPGTGFAPDLLKNQGEGEYSSHWPISQGATEGRMYIRLDAYKRGEELPPSFLKDLDEKLARARKDHLKIILRFAYAYGCQPPSGEPTYGGKAVVCDQDKKKGEPWNNFDDASDDTVVRHLKQLGPVLRRNSDVVSIAEGFVGLWGEGHSSTNGLSDQDAKAIQARRGLMDAMLKSYPGPISLRTPKARDQLGFDSAEQSRVGLDNDCFLASDHDAGTYEGDSQAARSKEKDDIGKVASTAPVGGELCRSNPPRTDCATALAELKQLHFSYLTAGVSDKVFPQWKADGCYDQIMSHLGYRFSLKSTTMDSQLKPNTVFHLKAVIHNDGFAAPYASRPVFAVFKCEGGWKSKPIALKGEDARSWQPDQDHTVDAGVPVPPNLPKGKCGVSMSLPDGCDPTNHDEKDADETARSENCKQSFNDPKNAIQFANGGDVWHGADGTNQLSDELLAGDSPVPACPHK
ncbi:MAG: DUF4832 domain-containing protein [Deltaproteobacteria bacterium]|nr:DUF4832 domain-containing protein [Deltaproteobacteria bacterium]